MRSGELARFAIGGLWRQKTRTVLTLVGVTVGTCALAFSLSLGLGLRAFIDNQFQSRDEFWRVIVHAQEAPPDASIVPPDKALVFGDMSDSRRERLHQVLVERYLATHRRQSVVPLTADKIAAIAALPDVSEVRTFRSSPARIAVDGAEKPVLGSAVTGQLADLQTRLIAGRLPSEPGQHEVVLSELALYDLGIRSDLEIERALGKPVRITIGGVNNTPPLALARLLTGRLPGDEITASQLELLEKLVAELPGKMDALDLSLKEKLELKRLLEAKPDLPDETVQDSAATASDTFILCGVVRVVTREERKEFGPLASWELLNAGIFLPQHPGLEFFDRLPSSRTTDLQRADVRVRPGGDLRGTIAAIESMGLGTFSSVKWFANAKREVTMIAGGLNLFAMIALFVAGIGITNTLVTSVVERTREIGILRSVGATRNQVLALFLLEGTLIGLTGSGLGLALARTLAIPADHWVWALIEKQSEGEKLIAMSIFEFPWWLSAGSIAFAIAVTTLAAYYPARRAARIHPIEALRYG